jgi:hypothetical protein
MRSDCLGEALNIIPKRSISYLLTAACIISTAQHARPNVRGHKEPALAHETKDKTLDVNHSTFIYYYRRSDLRTKLENPLGLLTPYIERLFFLPTTGEKSNAPLTAEYPTPGKSLARPPLTKTLLYLAHRYPRPGNLAVTLRPLFRLTFATCLMAELGFLGDIVTTRLTIPLACGHLFNIGVLERVGYLYLGPGFNFLVLRTAACLQVANYNLYYESLS